METFTRVLFVVAVVATVVGAAEWAAVMADASDTPAIVIVPQIISAQITAGFGVLVCAVCAGALALIRVVEAGRTSVPPEGAGGHEPAAR